MYLQRWHIIYLLGFFVIPHVCIIFAPVVEATSNANGYTNSEPGPGVKQQHRLPGNVDEQGQSNMQAGHVCKSCKQSHDYDKQKKEGKGQSHHSRDRIVLETSHSLKSVHPSKHLETSDSSSKHLETSDSSTKHLETISDEFVTSDSNISLPNEVHHLKVENAKSRDQIDQQMHPSLLEDEETFRKLAALTTEEKLERLSNVKKTRKKLSEVRKETSQSKSSIILQALVNTESLAESPIKKPERKLTIFRKSEGDSSNKLTGDVYFDQPVDVYPAADLSDPKTKNAYMNKLPQITRITMKVLKNRKANIANRQIKSLQSLDNATTKLDIKSSPVRLLNQFSNVSLPMSLQKIGGTRLSGTTATSHTGVQEHRANKDLQIMDKKAFHKGMRHDSLINNGFAADGTNNHFASDTQWSSDQTGNRGRGDLKENRLVRPSAADRLEQRISPDLNRSHRQLMGHLHRIMLVFSQSLQRLKSYNAEIFNVTRYDIMLGAREIIEIIHEANNYIYDSMTSATQFTREVMMKSHMNRNSRANSRLPEAPLELLESPVDKRDFQQQIEHANDEIRKVEAETQQINVMKMKCVQGESRLKQVRELFSINYDRSIVRDVYNYLNTSIIQINRGLRMSPQLRQLKRQKMYMDNVKDILMAANSLLIDSADGIHKGQRQMQANYDLYNKWRQKDQHSHVSRGVQSDIRLSMTSEHSGKLQELVSQAKKHAYRLNNQQNILQSILASPINAAKAVVPRKGYNVTQMELQILVNNLKPVLKDMFLSLETLRVYIGSKIKITHKKTCRPEIEGSGLTDSDDDEDFCEEEGSGFESSDNEKVFATDDEDFTFTAEPVDSAGPPLHPLKKLGLDLTDFTSRLVRNSQHMHDNAQNLQQSLAGLQQRWDNIESLYSAIEKSTDMHKDFILDLGDSSRSFQEVKSNIREISQKVANLKRLNLGNAVEKAKQALGKKKLHSEVNGRPPLEVILSEKKKEKTDDEKEDGTDKNGQLADDFSYSELFKQGEKIMSNHADIKLLRSMAIETCEKTGIHFTHIRSNMSLLRQKVERARQMLTSLQLSISKSGSGHIPLSIPQTYPEAASSLTTSIKVCVKPKSLEGTVLFVAGNNSASYSVTLDDGEIIVTVYNKQKGEIGSVTMDKMSVTEQWYTLEIQRTGETLFVTTVSQTGDIQTKSEIVTNLELLQPLPLIAYIGGLPQSLGISSESWEGCIGELTVNGRALALFSANSDGTKTSLCSDHCISDTQKLSIVFSGNGFAHFIRSVRERISSVTLKFKTYQKMTSLLSVTNRSQKFYLSVVMANGALKIESASPVENVMLLSLNSSLSDGKSHFLRIAYKGSRTYPELDGNREAFSVERTAPQILREVLDGVLVGAFVSNSRQFLRTPYRPFIGCVSDIAINDARLSLPDAADIYNTFLGNCKASSINIWQSCWKWTDHSQPLSLGTVEKSNRLSIMVSRDALGPLIHFTKEDKIDIEVTMTSEGVEVSSSDSENVMIRPEKDISYFTLITITDDGVNVFVKAWDQTANFKYGGWWGFVSKDLGTPHTVVLGEARDGIDRMFTGSISQFTIEDRFYDLSQFNATYNLSPCERPLEEIQPIAVTDVEESFSCI